MCTLCCLFKFIVDTKGKMNRREENRDIPEKNGVAQIVGDSVFTFFAFEFEQYVIFQFILRRSLDGDKLK